MRMIKETCPWPHPRVRPRIRNILPRYESYQSSCRTVLSLRRAALRCAAKRSSRLFLSFFFFFFFTLALRHPRPIPPLLPTVFQSLLLLLFPFLLLFLLLHLSFSRTSYYVLRRYEPLLLSGSDRPTDVCKSRVMQYASARESQIDAHNQSAIDRFPHAESHAIVRQYNGVFARCVLTIRWKSLKIKEIDENIY